MSYTANVWKYYVYTFFTSFFLIGPIVILFYLEHVSYSEFGIAFAVCAAFTFLFEVPSGVWADNMGCKKILVIGIVLGAAELFLIGFGKNFFWFIAAAMVGGLAAACISGAGTSLLYESLLNANRKTEAKRVYGRVRAIRYVAIVLAALMGAPLYTYNQSAPFYVSSVALLFAVPFVLSMHEPRNDSRQHLAEQFETIKRSFRIVLNTPRLQWVIAFAVLSGVSIWLFHDLLRSAYFESIGYPIIILGIITAIISTVRAFVSWYAEKVEGVIGIHNSVAFVLLAPVPLFFLMAYLWNVYALFLVILLYCVWSLQEVLAEVYTHEYITSNERATLFSVKSLVNMLALFIGFILVGVVVDFTSMRFALVFLALLSLASSAILFSKESLFKKN